MDTSYKKSLIVIMGNDKEMAYLLTRFAEQAGFNARYLQGKDLKEMIESLQPAAIIFTNITNFQAAESLCGELAACESVLLVCTSVAEEHLALTLGADACLHHPLQFAKFASVIHSFIPE